MTSNNFSAETEGLAVAAAYADAIKGRTILITGINRKGIGYATAESFASQSPKLLVLAGRTPAKLEECIKDLKSAYPGVEYRPLALDLSSQASVREAAKQVLSWTDVPVIDLLICNAGTMNIMTRTLTPEGIELTMATNHLGHFLLTNLLLPKIIASSKTASKKGSTRIVHLASSGTAVSGVRFSDLTYE
jgi:NAD(P)-dependent dehydrogenase (short-subunit alcohol dehydrogenase family)